MLRIAQEAGSRFVHLAAISTDRSIPLLALRPVLSETSTGDLVGAIHASLGLGKSRPGQDPIVLVDDAHLLDDQSAAVLHQVLVAQRARLLLTIESETSLSGNVAQILRSDFVHRIQLKLLSARETQELLLGAFEGPMDGRTTAQFVEASRVNLLVLRELISAALHSGSLRKRNGLWTLAGLMGNSPILTDLFEY